MSHALGLALYSYANDNSQLYPDGTNSTEVCQKLMDGGYVTDPSIFYIPMPGKSESHCRAKIENPEMCAGTSPRPVDLSTGQEACRSSS